MYTHVYIICVQYYACVCMYVCTVYAYTSNPLSSQELLGEVLLRNEEMRELREQLEILKAYNNTLLEKVILHCPELLEANNT